MFKYRHRLNKLLLKIKCGDKAKVDDVYELTFNHLKFIALHYLFKKSDFEDALCEAYYRMLKYIHSFNILKDGYNWLCRIVQNVANDMNKQNDNYVFQSEVNVDDFSFDEEVDNMLIKDELYQHIKTLPKLDRQLIFYRFYMGWPFDEIAQKFNRAKSFVYNRIKIICAKIQKNIEL